MADAKKAKEVSSTAIMFTEENVERRLPFKPDPQIGNLCIGTIDDVELVETETPKFNESGVESDWEYAGHTVPALRITFKQAPTKSDIKPRYYEHWFKVITSVDNKGDEVPTKTIMALYQGLYGQLRHICNAYKGLKEYDMKLSPKCPSIDPKASVEVRIQQFKAFFQFFYDLLQGKGDEPMYKGVKLYIKLVADYRTGKFLTIPTFVGRGFVERVLPDVNPSIALEPNETVVLTKGKAKGGTEQAVSNAGVDANTDPAIDDILKKYQ